MFNTDKMLQNLTNAQIFTFIWVILSNTFVFPQEQDVILPSPETAALFRYQDYPMDYSTGLPQISIPLLTINNRSLSVPISLSYHASGCKPSATDGSIAVGWSLNVGGMVSRTVNGSPDFGDHPFPNPFETDLDFNNDLDILERIMHFESPWSSYGQWLDSEYDIFSYNFGSQSGKFLFKDDNGVKTPVLLPKKPYQISAISDPVDGLQQIKITDDKGVRYAFTGTESRNSVGNTGFTLDTIISPDLKDQIYYTYSSTPVERKNISQTIVFKDQWDGNTGAYTNAKIQTQHPNREYYSGSRIVEINFQQGTVEFILKGGPSSDKDLIEYIILKDIEGDTIKKIKFIREPLHDIALSVSPSLTNISTHKLTRIEIQDKIQNIEYSYAFDYYPTEYSGVGDGNGLIDPRYIDIWGYYNASGVTDMVPYHDQVSTQSLGTGSIGYTEVGNHFTDREPSLSGLKSGVLKRIVYPTGGYSEFEYGNNRYYSIFENQKKSGPGLRVEKIVTFDAYGNSIDRVFDYGVIGNEQSDYGEIDIEPTLDVMISAKRYQYFNNGVDSHRERIFHSGFIPSLSELGSRPIRYTAVTEYKGSRTQNEGKTVYLYDNYRWGQQKFGNNQNSLEKRHIPKYKFWDTPMLKYQIDYKAIKNYLGLTSSYAERRKISNIYTPVESDTILGLHVQRVYEIPEATVQGSSQPFGEATAVFEHSIRVYEDIEYSIPVGTKNLDSTTEKLTYADGSTISTSTSYLYNSNNLVSEVNTNTSRINQITSQNSILKKEITYPFNYTTIVLNDMSNLNMLNYKVEEKNYFEGQPTSSSRINYKDWGNTIFRPESVETSKNGDVNLGLRTIYHGYDSQGNPQEISQENGPRTYYIWGYQETQPIAKIDNFEDSKITTGIQNLIDLARTASDADVDRTIDTIGTNGTKNYIGEEGDLREALDNLRAQLPADAQIVTYTYDPLIGATSMTDPRGYTIYYEYDDFNRLKEVRDAEGNIVSDYDYSYKQPISN